ncbi:methyltransferase domain protein, partial [Chlamydia ibidis]
ANDYHKTVKEDGHYYHKKVILPNLLPLLSLTPDSSVLDIGCGQGILERAIPQACDYLGIDLSSSLLKIAKKLSCVHKHQFLLHDLTLPLKKELGRQFSHAIAILSLQNMQNPELAIANTASLLKDGAKFFLVLNHPCFRIPRVSSWGYDESKKLIFRRLDRYLSPLKVPIVAHPSKSDSATTVSFHFPLAYWAQSLFKHNFVINNIQEWTSPKISAGKRAKAENFSRKEFPLFLLIACTKLT